jgi:hypothetical protein
MDFEIKKGVTPTFIRSLGSIEAPSKWARRMQRAKELRELGYSGKGSPKKPLESLNPVYRNHVESVAKYGHRTAKQAGIDKRGEDLKALCNDGFDGASIDPGPERPISHPKLNTEFDMNFNDRAAVIGMILGDGCLTDKYTPLVDGSKGKSAVFVCTHSIKQLPYCQYKANRMTQIFGGKTRVFFNEAILKGRDKPYRQCRFEKNNKYFSQLKDWLYTDGKKVITQRILDCLTDESLAFWFLDDGWTKWWRNVDGSITSCQMGLALCRPVQECDLVLLRLSKKYGVNGKIASVNKHNMLSFRTQDSIKLHKIIRPYAPKSMLYKVDANYAPHEPPTPVMTG